MGLLIMIARNCKTCNKEFKTYLSRLKRKGRKKPAQFCSISCSLKGSKRHTKPPTLEARKKIGLNTPKYNGSKHWNWKGGIHKDRKHRLKLHYIRTRRRLIKKRGNGGLYTLNEWELLKTQYGFTGPACKRKEPEIKLEADHIIPLSKGGFNVIENLQPLCRSCNAKKHTKIIKFDY